MNKQPTIGARVIATAHDVRGKVFGTLIEEIEPYIWVIHYEAKRYGTGSDWAIGAELNDGDIVTLIRNVRDFEVV